MQHRLPRASISFSHRQVYFHNIETGEIISSFLPVLLIDQNYIELNLRSSKQESLDDYIINKILACNGCYDDVQVDDVNEVRGVMNNIIHVDANAPQVINTMHESASGTSMTQGTSATFTLSSQTSCSTEQTSNASKAFDLFDSFTSRSSDLDGALELDEFERNDPKLKINEGKVKTNGTQISIPPTPKIDHLNAQWLVDVFFGGGT